MRIALQDGAVALEQTDRAAEGLFYADPFSPPSVPGKNGAQTDFDNNAK